MMTEMLPTVQKPLEAGSAGDPSALSSQNQEAFHPRLLVSQTIILQSGLACTVKINREPFAWCLGRGGWPLYNTVVICPVCLRHWLRFQLEDHPRAWTCWCWSCQSCTAERTEFPGTLLEIPGTGAFDEVLLEALPEQLLRREFEIHLKAFQ